MSGKPIYDEENRKKLQENASYNDSGSLISVKREDGYTEVYVNNSGVITHQTTSPPSGYYDRREQRQYTGWRHRGY
jgi:hypothetical protein